MQKINIQTADHYRWGDGCDGWPLAATPGLSVKRERMPPGTAEVAHHHIHARQVFYVLSGTLTLSGTETTLTLTTGDAAEIAPGTNHQAHNAGEEDAHFLVISTPSTDGDRILAKI